MKMAVVSMEMASGGTSPSRRRAGTETSVPRNGVSRCRRRPWSLSGVSSIVVGFTRHERLYRRRGGVGRVPRGPPHRVGPPPLCPRWPMVWRPWASPWLALLAPWVWRNRISVIFLDFSEHFGFWAFSAINRHNKQKLALWHLVNSLVQ